jgi:polysaccharide export outer membrane protein
VRAVLLVIMMVLAGACAPARAPHVADATSPPAAADAKRIGALYEARSGGAAHDYCLGPGDLLTVSVYGWDAMHDLPLRVGSAGTVSLPFIGDVPAAGRTERALEEDIARRLRNGYMRDPHVSVFVQRYQSQQVSVTGAVARPGLYSLSRDSRTLYDVLSQAGGLTADAGGRVRFSPGAGGGTACGSTRAPTQVASLAPIEFDLDASVAPGEPNPLQLPVLGGDSIVVTRGRFMVDGWVARPGLYTFTPGMTAYGAMSTAGGTLFPANLAKTEIVRARRDGTKEVLQVNLAEVGQGEAADVTLREGDVVRFPASPLKMVPYSVYWLFTNLFRVGAGISVAGV